MSKSNFAFSFQICSRFDVLHSPGTNWTLIDWRNLKALTTWNWVKCCSETYYVNSVTPSRQYRCILVAVNKVKHMGLFPSGIISLRLPFQSQMCRKIPSSINWQWRAGYFQLSGYKIPQMTLELCAKSFKKHQTCQAKGLNFGASLKDFSIKNSLDIFVSDSQVNFSGHHFCCKWFFERLLRSKRRSDPWNIQIKPQLDLCKSTLTLQPKYDNLESQFFITWTQVF